MKVYRASYILNSDMEGNLVDFFEFKQEKDDNWKKTDYGYFYPDGFLSQRVEDGVQVNNCLCHAKSERYFDRELGKEELDDLEVEMRKECVVALDIKRKILNKSISEQIEYIIR